MVIRQPPSILQLPTESAPGVPTSHEAVSRAPIDEEEVDDDEYDRYDEDDVALLI